MKTAQEIENIFVDGLKRQLGDRIESIIVVESSNEPITQVGIEFLAYKYCTIRFNYDRGSFGCCIVTGRQGVVLESTETWFDEANLDKFFQDIKSEIELRIPDKFLKAKGWMK